MFVPYTLEPQLGSKMGLQEGGVAHVLVLNTK